MGTDIAMVLAGVTEADLREACERYGWRLAVAPFAPDDADRAVLRTMASQSRRRVRAG